jgi:hypothetical protein
MILTVERFLNAVVFTNDKSDSSLGILDAREFVKVCLPLEQSINSPWMAIIAGIVERSPLPIILGHDISALSEEELKALLAALPAGRVERCALLLIPRLFVGSSVDQARHDIPVVVQGCEMKRCVELVTERVDVRTGLHQLGH